MQRWKDKQKLHANQRDLKDQEKSRDSSISTMKKIVMAILSTSIDDFGSFGSFESAHSHCNSTDDVKVPWYFILLDNENTHHTFYTKNTYVTFARSTSLYRSTPMED